MRTGYFGTFSEEDGLQGLQRAILAVRQNAEETRRILKKKEKDASPAVLAETPEISVQPHVHYLCVIKMSGSERLHEEKFFTTEDQPRAICDAIRWARFQGENLKAFGRIAEARISRLVMGEKDRTLAGAICFEWKAGGATTLDEEYDQAMAAMLLAKLDEVEKGLRRLEEN